MAFYFSLWDAVPGFRDAGGGVLFVVEVNAFLVFSRRPSRWIAVIRRDVVVTKKVS